MKPTFTILGTALMLLSIFQVKENYSIKSFTINDNHSTQKNVSNPDNVASITIGTQVWTGENLTVSRYRNGDVIPQVKDSVKWANLTTGAWCWYKNDSVTYANYGKLYNWYAINDPRGLAPAGWHIPSDSEWYIVANFLGTNANNAGGKMKETGVAHWLDPNVGATNSTGFSALPAGYRNNLGQFYYINFLGYWWSSTAYGAKFALCRRLVSYGGFMDRMFYEKRKGFSVRCVKD